MMPSVLTDCCAPVGDSRAAQNPVRSQIGKCLKRRGRQVRSSVARKQMFVGRTRLLRPAARLTPSPKPQLPGQSAKMARGTADRKSRRNSPVYA